MNLVYLRVDAYRESPVTAAKVTPATGLSPHQSVSVCVCVFLRAFTGRNGEFSRNEQPGPARAAIQPGFSLLPSSPFTVLVGQKTRLDARDRVDLRANTKQEPTRMSGWCQQVGMEGYEIMFALFESTRQDWRNRWGWTQTMWGKRWSLASQKTTRMMLWLGGPHSPWWVRASFAHGQVAAPASSSRAELLAKKTLSVSAPLRWSSSFSSFTLM